MKGIMIQGTSSDVGKSLIVTALCRHLSNQGLKVAPFKSQNMSNNSYVTADGKEIGRAQGIQAEAARTEATTSMNPILLKPRSEKEAEVVLNGQVVETLSGSRYRQTFYERGQEAIAFALEELKSTYEILVIEGAGSPVEMNLNDRELVNMKVAEMADVPVVLVADIDRGGVFASIVGTLELLTPIQRKRVRGIIINKFRGERELFHSGIKWLEEKTGIPVLGLLPYIEHHGIDGEDSLSIEHHYFGKKKGNLDIAVIRLPLISNYSDFESFASEADVSIRWVQHVSEFGQPDAVIIPGTKSTIADLDFLIENHWDECLQDFVAAGGYLVGICGGYQMLGNEIIDEAGTDTGHKKLKVEGLRMIPAITIFENEKDTIRVKGRIHPATRIRNTPSIEGYEIHLGRTTVDELHAFLQLEGNRSEGYYGQNGRIIGTYLHHLFFNDEWRNIWLNRLRVEKGLEEKEVVNTRNVKDMKYDELAASFEKYLDWESLGKIIDQWDAEQ
ncbi:cobyric acid synthase [Cytobacillus sp. Hz8]|uniref:cobyric acid synthase n=1 Tax=Cytobacillus sp. Hz8 TaxID=3347168 RepID=UPI0035E3510B